MIDSQNSDPSKKLRDAEIVIIGAGAVGAAVAYHLAQAGKTDVLVLEKESSVAAETTSQAAGLVGQVRSTIQRTQLAMWSVQTFRKLQESENYNPSWREVGSLRVALNDQRVEEFQQLAQVAKQSGLEVEFIDQNTASEKWPAIDFRRAKSILWCPTDGYLQPYDLTMAYVSQSRKLGVRFVTDVRVDDIVVQNNSVTGVITNQGTLNCQMVINAAGAHAYSVAKLVGVELPIIPVRHEFFITIATKELSPTLPVVRIPDLSLYLRADVNSLLLGGWEPSSISTDPQQLTTEKPSPVIEDDWEVLSWFVEQLTPEFRKVNDLGIRSVFKGWPTFTPDGRFIIGELDKVAGFVMAGGCNAHGVSGSAGIGRHVVESILESEPSAYVKSLSPNRFLTTAWDWSTATRQAKAVYETYYALEMK